MSEKWRIAEKLATEFGHEWAGFYTWLSNAGQGWKGLFHDELAEQALIVFEAWNGEGPMPEKVNEAYTFWLYEVVEASPDLPGGIWPTLNHTTGTGRLEWSIEDKFVEFWIHRPCPDDSAGRERPPITVLNAEIQLSKDGYWEIKNVFTSVEPFCERHVWALCKALGAFLPTGEVAKHTAKVWLQAFPDTPTLTPEEEERVLRSMELVTALGRNQI
jgi:hypothetical protein